MVMREDDELLSQFSAQICPVGPAIDPVSLSNWNFQPSLQIHV